MVTYGSARLIPLDKGRSSAPAGQNEKKAALFMAAQASEAAKAAELEVAEDEARSACIEAWQKYHLEELDADYIRITAGPLAYAKEEARIFGHKPLCSKPDASFDGTFRDLVLSLHHIDAEYGYWYAAALANRYASDRKLQTRHLLHQAWAKMIAPETPENWAKFLAQNYPDIDMRNCSTSACQPGERPAKK
ncbi:MAG: hypothetical protein ACLQOO_24440 [Terriglobia bacterium]